MASALTASSQIALRAAVSTFCGGKWDVDFDELVAHLRGRLPILGAVMAKRDVSLALRAVKYVRDHDAGRTAWKHQDRDHPRWGRRA
ncbi:MAG TPA: hypothetical protein VJM09_05210 [Sphingobium sp.]|nr:hypothetical protein [Sphingobium sp.]